MIFMSCPQWIVLGRMLDFDTKKEGRKVRQRHTVEQIIRNLC